MKRLVFVALPLIFLAACSGNRAPGRPELTGPATGRPNDTLVFTVMSTDPEGGEVSYKIAWGDTSSIEWSPYYAGGQDVRRAHLFAESGRYVVRAVARDPQEKESGWSDSLVVMIEMLPPGRPIAPVGQQYCTTAISYTYKTVATHPQGEGLEYQFDWSGLVGDWGHETPSGETVAVEHVFDSAGTYPVTARARDDGGLLSAWSDPLLVTVIDIPGGPARNLSLLAASDTTVRLYWSPPVEGRPNYYRVWFKPVGGTYALALETGDTTCEHNPSGYTGDYRVEALFGARLYPSADTLTTLPVHTGTMTVGELSGTDLPGCGWPGPEWLAKAYLIGDTTWVDSVEFYVTDFKVGSSGPTYFLASPDLAPSDTGGDVPAGRWHSTRLAVLADEQGPVPAVGDTAWKSTVLVADVPVYAACHTERGYFAVVKVTQLRISNEDLRLQAWVQPVQGLRLLRH